jgi:hypothetical protein
MYNNIETLIKHQGWARGSKINYLIQKNMVEGKSKEEIEELSLKNKIFHPRSFKATWKLFDKIKPDIKWAG